MEGGKTATKTMGTTGGGETKKETKKEPGRVVGQGELMLRCLLMSLGQLAVVLGLAERTLWSMEARAEAAAAGRDWAAEAFPSVLASALLWTAVAELESGRRLGAAFPALWLVAHFAVLWFVRSCVELALLGGLGCDAEEPATGHLCSAASVSWLCCLFLLVCGSVAALFSAFRLHRRPNPPSQTV